MIKPDGLEFEAEAVSALNSVGLSLVREERVRMSEQQVAELYPERIPGIFEKEMLDYMTAGDVIYCEVEGNNACQLVRQVKGKTKRSGLRLLYAQNMIHNTFHCPDDETCFEREREVILHES